MKFEFGKYSEVTELAHRVNGEYKMNGYTRIFMCPDVNDVWLARILPGFNEDYEREEGCFLLERDKIPHETKGQELTANRAQRILREDSFDNWDILQGYSEKELLDNLDDGFGILNLNEG
jgi:hypothetical protein